RRSIESVSRWCCACATWMVSLEESPRCLPADGAVHIQHGWWNLVGRLPDEKARMHSSGPAHAQKRVAF
ncbi:unnamed protein product, partial [Staurois parvus]